MKKIWAKNFAKEMNVRLAFRIVGIKADRIELCALNTYSVYWNGKLLHCGPARAAKGYIRKDIVPLPKEEKGCLVVLVNGYNVNSYYVNDEAPCFGATVYLKEKIVAETDDFVCYELTDMPRKTQRYSFQRPFTEMYKMEEDRQKFYLGGDLFPVRETEEVSGYRELPRHVPLPRMIEKKGRLCEGGKVREETRENWRFRSMFPTETFKAFPLQEVEEILSDTVGSFGYERDRANNLLTSMRYTVYEFSHTQTGFFGLQAEVLEDAELYVLFDEIDWQEFEKTKYRNIVYNRNTCVNVVKWELKKGKYQLRTSEPYVGRYFKCVVRRGCVHISGFSLITYENPHIYDLKLKCKDKKIAAVLKAAQNTLAQNAVDILMDCPGRERAGWLCDGYFSGKAESFLFGENEAERSFLENYALAPQSPYLPEGMIPMCYPGDHLNGNFIPNWSLWYIEELYEYYSRSKNYTMVEQSRSKVKGVLNYFEKFENEYGLLEDLEKWVFVEWSKANDRDRIIGVNFPSNMLYAHALEAAGQLYHENQYIEKAKRLREAICRMSFNGTYFEDNAIRNRKGELVLVGHLSEVCQYYAFYFKTADPRQYERLYRLMKEEFGPRRAAGAYPQVAKANAIVGNTLRMLYLLQQGERALVLSESLDYFYRMAKRTGTLWEHDSPHGSLNHCFAAVAANVLLDCYCGFGGFDPENETPVLSCPIADAFELKAPYKNKLWKIVRENSKTTARLL